MKRIALSYLVFPCQGFCNSNSGGNNIIIKRVIRGLFRANEDSFSVIFSAIENEKIDCDSR